MRTGFLKKIAVLGKHDSTSEEKLIKLSGIKLEDLKIEGKFDLTVASKKIKPKEIQVLEEFTEESTIVIFDLEDWDKLLKKLSLQPENILDLKELSRILLPRLKDFKLETVAKYFNLDLTYSRREAELVNQLMLALIHKIQNLSPSVFQQLMSLSFGAKDSWSKFLFEGRKIELKDFIPLEENEVLLLDFQGSRGERETGSKKNYSFIWLKEEEVLDYYQSGGLISSQMKKFEQREEQKRMAQNVTSAFNQGEFLLVEAGAGVGKSLAYLVPALLWAEKNNEKSVISTNTKNLQEQLFFKDLPLLEKSLPFKFKVALLKGKRNYLCLYRLYDWINKSEYELSLEDQRCLANLAVWASETRSGDVAEDSGFDLSKDFSIWNRVQCDGSFCLNQECPYYQRCFYFKIRREAQKSDLLVVNHSLLFSDLLAEGKTLAADNLILDEAHNLENVATQFLGNELSFWKIKEVLDQIYHRKLQTEWGVLGEIKSKFQQGYLKKAEKVWLEEKLKKGIEEVLKTYKFSEEFFKKIPPGLKRYSSNDSFKLRYKKDDPLIPELKEEGENLLNHFKKLKDGLEVISTGLEEFKSSEIEGKYENLQQLQADVAEIQSLIDTAKALFSAEDEGFVFWIEFPAQREGLDSKFYMAPLEVGESLNQLLYENLRTVVFTSATLSVNGDFSYIKERLGLNLVEEERVKTLCLGSAFTFEKQAKVLIPSFIPSPKAEGYVEASKELIKECGKKYRKNILALFTSYEMLDKVYKSLKSGFEEEGIVFLAQGRDGQSTNLFERFKGEEGAILLGTSSFWEGVDAPGKALEILILVKLPFAVPTEPLVSARMEKLESAGENPFLSYSLPEAVIKFKQGFGRLIRKKDDYGLVIILDSRVLTQRYGRFFLDSLPVKSGVVKNKKELLDEISRWFGKETKSTQLKN
jgi:predicted DnaQ family exonuclease/DinG family helicase